MNQPSSNETSLSENGGLPRTRIRAIALALLAAVGICLCYRLAKPCIPSLVWAGALASVFNPLHRWIEARVRRPNLAAAFSLVIIGSLVVAPATWFAQMLAEQATSVPEYVQKQVAAGKWRMPDDQHPQLAHFLALVEREVSSPENVSMATTWLKTTLSRLAEETAIAAVQVSPALAPRNCRSAWVIDVVIDWLSEVSRWLPWRESARSLSTYSRIRDRDAGRIFD
jgi:predicted PurR-regulated permease PerM